jgi:hypothetical protein
MVKVKSGKRFALLLSAMLLFAGCSSTNEINNTPSVKNLRKSLCDFSSSNRVDVSFTAPNLYIKIYLSDDDTAPVDKVFEMVKTFTNDSTIKEMGLGSDINVDLYIFTKSATYTYSTSYYKTNNNTDNSPDNVIDFKVWIEGCVIYHSYE